MKNIGFAILIALLFINLSGFSQAKTKFGHLNSNDLFALMPEKEAAQKTLQTYSKQLEDQLVAMQDELEKKYTAYQAEQATLTDMIKKTKEEELTTMQQRIQTFQTNAQQELQKKESELLQPIIEKAKKAIEEVSKDNGYTYVFDTGTGTLLYWPKDADDILPLVKTKLGIK
jgi:outer membrane protein